MAGRSGSGDRRPGRRLARPLGLALLAAAVALAVGALLFPHLSSNHDEGVYLQQAAMLLEGRLFLRPPVEGAFRPWFFVDAGGRLYAKYAPVTAAVFALGKLLGAARFGVALAAGAFVAGTYGVARETFAGRADRDRLALYAAGFVLASPLFLVHAGLFLPYLPTAALNVAFAYGYLRADRTGSRRWAAIAGAAVGLAFFSRPYTAVLFALPFVAHALWRLREPSRALVVRKGIVAVLGLAGVAVALAYNAAVAGDPLTFPYQAFAPRDGLGFGRRAILGHELIYSPSLALRANAEVVAQLFGRWVAFGAAGAALAVAGLAAAFRGRIAALRHRIPALKADTAGQRDGLGDRLGRRTALAGTFATVVAGNVYFWGNLNVLGVLGDPWDGLVHYYGPFYHFDLLVPTAVFAALGGRVAWSRLRDAVERWAPDGQVRGAALAALAVAGLVLAATGGAAVAVPVAENAAVTAQLDEAYAPFADRDLGGALVFLPTPYGDWLNHPLQRLRNDPGFDGRTVYATDGREAFALVDAYPDRRYYRYAFRGPWTPVAGGPVDARLQRVRSVRGERVTAAATVGVPASARDLSLTLSTDRGRTRYVVGRPDRRTRFSVTVANGSARIVGPGVTPVGNGSVPVADRDTVTATAFVDYPVGGFDYRVELPVARSGGRVWALTPRLEVCRVARLCGGQAAYVPGSHAEGVAMNVTLAAGDKA